METQYDFTRSEIDRHFEKLQAGLSRLQAGTECPERLRGVKADGFMLMHREEFAVYFKDIGTRNYLTMDAVYFDILAPVTSRPFWRGEYTITREA